jgi:hypothetical protein
MNGQFSNLDEFWPFYLSQHLHPNNRRLHFIGTNLALLLLVLAASTRSWPFAVAALVVGYGCAWVGHFFFEKNKPATFTYPWLSFRGDIRMLALSWTNQLDAEILLRMKDIRRYARG